MGSSGKPTSPGGLTDGTSGSSLSSRLARDIASTLMQPYNSGVGAAAAFEGHWIIQLLASPLGKKEPDEVQDDPCCLYPSHLRRKCLSLSFQGTQYRKLLSTVIKGTRGVTLFCGLVRSQGRDFGTEKAEPELLLSLLCWMTRTWLPHSDSQKHVKKITSH